MESWREELYLRELYHSLDSPDPDELYHYGIPGMKWYIRRFQNADGSLTPRGRKHYGVGPPLEDGDFKEDLSLNKKYMRDRENYLRIKRSEAEKDDKKWTEKKQKEEAEKEKSDYIKNLRKTYEIDEYTAPEMVEEAARKKVAELRNKYGIDPYVPPENVMAIAKERDTKEWSDKGLELLRTLGKSLVGEEDEGSVDAGAAFVEKPSGAKTDEDFSKSSTSSTSKSSEKSSGAKTDEDFSKSSTSSTSKPSEQSGKPTIERASKQELDDETAYEQTVKKYREAHRDNSEQARRKEEIDDETAYEQTVKKYREAHRDNSQEARDLEEAARRRGELEEETRRQESIKKYREAQRANSEEARELEDIRRKTDRQKAENDLRAAQRAESEYRQQKLIEERQRTAKAYVDAASYMSKAGGAFSAGGGYMNTSVRNGRDFLSNQTWTRYSEKQLAKMSNEEFRQALDRMDLERRYSALTANDQLKGKQAASDLLYSMGALTSAASGVAGVAASLYSIKNKVSGGSGSSEKKK